MNGPTPPAFRRWRMGAGSPSKAMLEAQSQFAMPKPRSTDASEMFKQAEAVVRPQEVINGVGFTAAEQNDWVQFLTGELCDDYTNELRIRRNIHAKMQEDRVDPQARKVMMQKALSFYRRRRRLRKSPEIYTVDDMRKAEARGGKYHRRTTNETGRHRYFYDEASYAQRADSHVSGAEAKLSRMRSEIGRRIERAGTNGCHPKEFCDLANKYGHKELTKMLKGCCNEASMAYRAPNFYGIKKTKPKPKGPKLVISK